MIENIRLTHGIIPGGKSRKPMIASLDKPHRITAGQNNIGAPKMLNGFGAIKSLSLSIFHYQNLIFPIVPCKVIAFIRSLLLFLITLYIVPLFLAF